MPGTMAPTLPASVLSQYDLIGFDPRGVGHSTPMSCGLSDASLAAAFPYPAADGSITQNVTEARTVAADCAKIGGELQYFTTANTARDMDRVRAALGAKKISYWGQSYGTYLGAVYTTLFPRRTDRMILEGNIDPNIGWSKQLQLWNQGLNQRFPDAAKVAAAANASLGLGSSAAQVTRTYIALARHLDTDPAAVPGASASINGNDLRNVTYELLLHNPTLTPLTQFWKAAADLSAGKAPTATDTAVLQQVLASTPAEPGVPADNQTTMTFALVCGDTSWPHDVQSYAAATAAAQAKYPLSDGMPDNIWPCAFWSKAPVEPAVKVTAGGPRDILLLQNQRDNATPWAGAWAWPGPWAPGQVSSAWTTAATTYTASAQPAPTGPRWRSSAREPSRPSRCHAPPRRHRNRAAPSSKDQIMTDNSPQAAETITRPADASGASGSPSGADRKRGRRERRLARAAVAAQVLFVASMLLAASWQGPRYSLLADSMSDMYALNAPAAAFLIIMLTIAGAVTMWFVFRSLRPALRSALLPQAGSARRLVTIGCWLLAFSIFGIGNLLTIFMRLDCRLVDAGCTPAKQVSNFGGTLDNTISSVGVLVFIAAGFLLGMAMNRTASWKSLVRPTRRFMVVMIVWVIGDAVSGYGGDHPGGLFERLIAFTGAVWITYIAVAVSRRRQPLG